MKQNLIDILDLFEKQEIKLFFQIFNPALVQLYHMDKMELSVDVRIDFEQILEKYLPDIISAYLAIPMSEHNQVLRHDKTATEILVEQLILLKHQIDTLWQRAIEDKKTKFIVMNRKLNSIHTSSLDLEMTHETEQKNLPDNLPIYNLEQDIQTMLREYRSQRTWNNGFKTQAEQQRISQKKGLTPVTFSLIVLVILFLLVILLLF